MLTGQTVEAMERFYADDVTIQENSESPRVGKVTCLEQERKNIANVAQMQAHLLNQVLDKTADIVFSEWRFEYTDLSGNRLSLSEISVQKWQNERITSERFYYDKSTPIL